MGRGLEPLRDKAATADAATDVVRAIMLSYSL